MKRLIVLSVSVTLLAFLPGCSILGKHNAKPCDATSSLTSKLHRFRLKNILPWRSANSQQCVECNEGFSEVGYSDGQVIDGGYVSDSYGTPVEGGIVSNTYSAPIEGSIVADSYAGPIYGSPSIDEGSLYSADVVGPISISNEVQTAKPVSSGWESLPVPVAH